MPLEKQLKMMRVILHLHGRAQGLVAAGVPLSRITGTGLFDKLVRVKYEVPNDHLEKAGRPDEGNRCGAGRALRVRL